MDLIEKNGITFFQFSNLARFPDIRHGVFTRHGGCSQGPFRDLNVGCNVGDEPDRVHRNRDIVSTCMENIPLVFLNQVHGTQVLVFEKDDQACMDRVRDCAAVSDAVITDLPQKNLCIQVADCQAVLMFDSVKKVVANVHSGWRGSIKNIIGLTIEAMKKKFGCRPCDIFAGIGPSLGPCCAEFVNYKKEIPKKFWEYRIGSGHFDFWSLSFDQLIGAGLLSKNINISNICTKCHSDMFFSYRKEAITGRFAAVIGLK